MRRHLRKVLPGHDSVKEHRWLRLFENSLLHPRLWHLNRHSVAGAVAVGLFCGLIPGPLQMLGAAIGALIFRVNLPLALVATWYTNPFTIVPLYVAAYHMGRFAIGSDGGFVSPPSFDWADIAASSTALLDWMIGLGKPLGIGLLLLASGLAVLGYFATKAAWRLYLLHNWRSRKKRPQRPA